MAVLWMEDRMYCGWRMMSWKFSRKHRNKELKSWAEPINTSSTKQ